MMNGSTLCTIAIPVYKQTPSESELNSLKQCITILTKHPIVLFHSHDLDISAYSLYFKKYNKSFTSVTFDALYFSSVKGYNALLLSPLFYERFLQSQYLLIYQLDAWVFSDELSKWCEKDVDYIGAPWFEDFSDHGNFLGVGNGGFSLRNIQASIHVLTKFKQIQNSPDHFQNYKDIFSTQFLQYCFTAFYLNQIENIAAWQNIPNEDAFWGLIVPKLFSEFRVASIPMAIAFSFERGPEILFAMNGNRLPFGCHAWEKHNPDFWKSYIKQPVFHQVNLIRAKEEINPRITLVTPSYNQGEYLEETIDSVLSQGYANLEYMILDGGSSDNSVEIIQKYEKYLTFWRSQRDAGQYPAITEGLNRATGEIQGWLNADDLLFPHTLKTIAEQFQAHSEVQWITGIPCEITAEKKVTYGKSIPLYTRQKLLQGLFWCPYIQQEGSFWKTSLWKQAGAVIGCDSELASDLELWLRFSRYTDLWTTDCSLGIFRRHKDQKSAAQYADYLIEAFRLIENESEKYPIRADSVGLPHILKTGEDKERFKHHQAALFNSVNDLATALCFLKTSIPENIYRCMLSAVMSEPILEPVMNRLFDRLSTPDSPTSDPGMIRILRSIQTDSLFMNKKSTFTFTIATSIAPKGLDLQRKAIASWRTLGFQVVSFNNAREVAQLTPEFPEVRFVTVKRDGTQRSGKPLVYVQDVLAWFRSNTEIRFGGFINSDIVVAPENPEAFLALLEREISGSLIFSRRIEVENIDKLEGKWNRTGIDLWLWDREILHCYTEPADYMVGFPHWDYYMELMPICHGIPVKQLAIPNAYHQTHDAYYDWVRDAVPFALTTFRLIYPYLDRIPDKDHLLLPTINYCFKHQPAEIKNQDDLEFLAMFLNTLDKFFLETIDRCSLKLNYFDVPHVPQDNRLSLCHNPEAYLQPAKPMEMTVSRVDWNMTLATSLSPFDIEKQLDSVASWILLGCKVVSFNNAQEISQLKSYFPSVQFVTVFRDGQEQTGRPLIFMDDILQWFRASDLPFGGFINADIILQPSQPEVFKRLVKEQIDGSLLFARRVDIENMGMLSTFWQTLKGTWVRSGIDLWLFDCDLLKDYLFQTDYMIGMPHWDYFMCLWPLAMQHQIKEIAVPCIFHPMHQQRYDFANQMKYGMKTYMHLASHLSKFPVLDQALLKFVDFFARHQPSRSDDEYGQKFYDAFRYALDIFFLETIFSNCKRVSYADVSGSRDDIVPGYNHPLHAFGTLQVLLRR